MRRELVCTPVLVLVLLSGCRVFVDGSQDLVFKFNENPRHVHVDSGNASWGMFVHDPQVRARWAVSC